ncbi:MAG: hypothetical protein ACREB9_07580, partial [Thermoplasmata archaeon]
MAAQRALEIIEGKEPGVEAVVSPTTATATAPLKQYKSPAWQRAAYSRYRRRHPDKVRKTQQEYHAR